MDEEDTKSVSADDALEADRESSFTQPKKPVSDEAGISDDYPAAPADSNQHLVSDDHQKLDTNQDPHELYDEGIEGAQDGTA